MTDKIIIGFFAAAVLLLILALGVSFGIDIYTESPATAKENKRAELAEFYREAMASEETRDELDSRITEFMNERNAAEVALKQDVMTFARPVHTKLYLETSMDDFLVIADAEKVLNAMRQQDGKEPLSKEEVFLKHREEAISAITQRYGSYLEVFSEGTVRLDSGALGVNSPTTIGTLAGNFVMITSTPYSNMCSAKDVEFRNKLVVSFTLGAYATEDAWKKEPLFEGPVRSLCENKIGHPKRLEHGSFFVFKRPDVKVFPVTEAASIGRIDILGRGDALYFIRLGQLKNLVLEQGAFQYILGAGNPSGGNSLFEFTGAVTSSQDIGAPIYFVDEGELKLVGFVVSSGVGVPAEEILSGREEFSK